MLSTIEDRKSVRRHQEAIQSALLRHAGTPPIDCKIIYRPYTENVSVHWSPSFGIWFYSKPSTNRYWNAFGVSEPKPGSRIRIACEINFPFRGVRRDIGGVLVSESNGEVFIGHRGKFGGGSKGINKEIFMSWFRDQLEETLDRGVTSRIAVIGEVGSENLAGQIAAFVHRCAELKERVHPSGAAGESRPPRRPAFRPEFFGEREYEMHGRISAKCNHGILVNKLAESLKALGARVHNTRHQDLLAVSGQSDNHATLFEVKTDVSLGSVYTAIGQLLYHAGSLTSQPKLVAVLPSGIPQSVRSRLRGLKIEVLPFRWNGGRAIFSNLRRYV